MGAITLRLMENYGVVGYDAMRTRDVPVPRWVFMLGAQYTPLEFAHSVCAPGEYVALTSDSSQPYGQEVEVDVADNWLHQRFLNVPIDTLLHRTENAVAQGHGVCWESRSHAMAIVGLARDTLGHRYFVMKNSWGTDRPYQGLEYLSFRYFRKHTLAVEMPRDAYEASAFGSVSRKDSTICSASR
jgi:bleomycin hydrolase